MGSTVIYCLIHASYMAVQVIMILFYFVNFTFQHQNHNKTIVRSVRDNWRKVRTIISWCLSIQTISVQYVVGLRPKNGYVSQAPPASPSTPASKFFIPFQVFTLRTRLYIVNCQFKLVGW